MLDIHAQTGPEKTQTASRVLFSEASVDRIVTAELGVQDEADSLRSVSPSSDVPPQPALNPPKRFCRRLASFDGGPVIDPSSEIVGNVQNALKATMRKSDGIFAPMPRQSAHASLERNLRSLKCQPAMVQASQSRIPRSPNSAPHLRGQITVSKSNQLRRRQRYNAMSYQRRLARGRNTTFPIETLW